ncbi:unnamed protein product [Schistosoma curassoni]|nr:unnamed protein product [Schistosoma curassoni]
MFHSLLFDIIVLHLIMLVSIQVDGKRQKLHSFGNPEVILSNLKVNLGEFALSLHHADYQVQEEMDRLLRIYSIDEEVFTKYIKCFDLSAHLLYKTNFGQGLDKLVDSVMNKREAKVAKSSSRYKCLQKELKKIKKKAVQYSGTQCEIPTGLNYKDMETLIELSRNKYRIINSYNESLFKYGLILDFVNKAKPSKLISYRFHID